jgi:hypothetical protein
MQHRIDKISPRIIPLLIATFASFNSSNLPRFIIQKINAENNPVTPK